MKRNKIYTVKFKRKREGKTDYKKRLKYLISNKPRIVVRRSLKSITIQLVEYKEEGDKVIKTLRANELKKYGWNLPTGNIPSAYLTGLLFAKKIKVKECVIDFGMVSITKGSRLAAVIKGLADGGIKINYSEEIIPPKERIEGINTKDSQSQKKFEEVKANILK